MPVGWKYHHEYLMYFLLVPILLNYGMKLNEIRVIWTLYFKIVVYSLHRLVLICTPTVECQDFKQEELLLPMNILQLGNEFLMRKMEIKSNEKKNIVVYSVSQANII